MKLFTRKQGTTLDEIHQYVQDLKDLQEQQTIAKSFNNIEQYKRYGVDIELMQKVLERLLENLEIND